MKQFIKTWAALVVLVFLPGCFQVHTLIKVKKDGSGTIEQTTLINKDGFIARLEQMAAQKGIELEKPAQKPDIDLSSFFNEEKLKKSADNFGDGVKFLTAEKISVGKLRGYKAFYAFSDISSIRLTQNPNGNFPAKQSHLKANLQKGSPDSNEQITFHFTKGNPLSLIISNPTQVMDEKALQPSPTQPQETDMTIAQLEEATARMKQVVQDMKIFMAVDIEGTIVKTNASNKKGSRIVLMDLDFEKLLANPEELKKFAQLQPETIGDAVAFLKNLPGFQMELNGEVKVDFK